MRGRHRGLRRAGDFFLAQAWLYRIRVVERDNQLGQEASVKRVYRIDPSAVSFTAHGSELPTLDKRLLRHVQGDLDAASISVPHKVEGMTISAHGQVYLATDNDGVDENYGETLFLDLGTAERLLGG